MMECKSCEIPQTYFKWGLCDISNYVLDNYGVHFKVGENKDNIDLNNIYRHPYGYVGTTVNNKFIHIDIDYHSGRIKLKE